MKKIIKFLLLFLIVVIAVHMLSNVTYAMNIHDIDVPANNIFNGIGNSIVKLLSTVGSIISVLVLIILGIKYMMGSVEEKAEYKKTLLPYMIGAILVFSASIIAQIIYDIAIKL